jgi:hypothetical protein
LWTRIIAWCVVSSIRFRHVVLLTVQTLPNEDGVYPPFKVSVSRCTGAPKML